MQFLNKTLVHGKANMTNELESTYHLEPGFENEPSYNILSGLIENLVSWEHGSLV
jgi:hypothetical protein